jgi:hypothetical protein
VGSWAGVSLDGPSSGAVISVELVVGINPCSYRPVVCGVMSDRSGLSGSTRAVSTPVGQCKPLSSARDAHTNASERSPVRAWQAVVGIGHCERWVAGSQNRRSARPHGFNASNSGLVGTILDEWSMGVGQRSGVA